LARLQLRRTTSLGFAYRLKQEEFFTAFEENFLTLPFPMPFPPKGEELPTKQHYSKTEQ